MSKNYKQLSPEQRYQIESLLHCGISQKQIATTINVNASTISRELKRNTPQRGRGALQYGATNAQRRTALRHKEKSKH
jgi:IS30 family transposase